MLGRCENTSPLVVTDLIDGIRHARAIKATTRLEIIQGPIRAPPRDGALRQPSTPLEFEYGRVVDRSRLRQMHSEPAGGEEVLIMAPEPMAKRDMSNQPRQNADRAALGPSSGWRF